MATALVGLATTTLASSSATVTFSSISQSYRDLRLIVTIPSGYAGSGSGIRFNSDTDYANNYSRVVMAGNGSSAYSFVNSGSSNPAANHDLGGLRADGNLIVDIMDYTATDKHKTILVRENGAANEAHAQSSRWASTAAINYILFSRDDAGNLPAGTVLSLYGIVS